MRNHARGLLLEHSMMTHGEAKDALKIGALQTDFACELFVGDLAVEWNLRGNVVGIDCIQTGTVQLWNMLLADMAKVFDVANGIAHHWTKLHRGTVEQVLKLHCRVDGFLLSLLHF